MPAQNSKGWRLRRTATGCVVDRLDRVGAWSACCIITLAEPSGPVLRTLTISNKRLFVEPAHPHREPDPFKGDSRELRRVIARGVQVGLFNARLETGETLTLTFDT